MPLLHGNLAPALRRHWTKSVSCAAAVAMLTLVGIRCWRPHYVSEARLAVGLQGPQAYPLTRAEMEQIAQDIGSPARLAHLVDALGPGTIVPAPGAKDASGHRQEAIHRLGGILQITPAHRPAEIVIRGTAERPKLAEQIVAALASHCVDDSPRLTPATMPAEPSNNERATRERSFESALDHLREAQRTASDVSLAGRRKLIEDQLSEVEVQLLRELSKHEADERRLSSQLTPAHPQLVALRELIAELSRQIAGEGSEHRMPGGVGKLCSRREELRQELAALNQREGRVAEAVQRVEQAQANLDELSPHEASRITVQPPVRRVLLTLVAPASSARPVGGVSPLLAGALASGLALVGAIGVPLLCYRSNPSLMTCRDVESELELPVAGPIPTGDALLEVAV
jgi:hypothetical protein